MSSASTPLIHLPSPPPLPTFEDFLAWARAHDVRAEWVAGEVIGMSPSNLEHQRLLAFLYELLQAFARAHALGEVFFAPVAMKLPTRPSGREPDLLFVAAAHADRLKETHVDGPADLVVEIVSPESDARDRGDKFVEYEGAGITEYWLIDPLRRAAAFFQLAAQGRYQAGPVTADGVYHSLVLSGFRLRVDWLWQRPAVAGALQEVGL